MSEKNQYVIVRTYSAGVHVGTLESSDGKEVKLTNARRVWYWSGANTLNEISLHGVSDKSRISEAVPEIYLTEAIEIIPCSDEAKGKLDRSIWSRI